MEIKNILNKLAIIQERLVCTKNQYNSFGKFYYRNCEDILQSLKPLLAETKTVLTITDDVVFVEGRHYIKATATIWDIESGERFSVSALAREEESKKGVTSDQVTGSTSSYARKYALNGMFCIDDNKDADTQYNTKEDDRPKESDLDKKFQEYWDSLTDDKRAKIGASYPNKFGKPQLNPTYFKKSEKEEILKKVGRL